MGVSEIHLNSEIEIFIPQRPPFVMVDKILSSDEKSTRTQFTVKEDNLFCCDGVFLEPGIIENIAQSAAARAGYIAKANGEEPVLGFIGVIKNLKINFLPEVKKDIITVINVEGEVLNALIINAKSESDGNVAAECEMKIFSAKIK